jgi:monoamine oxidase
VKRRNALKYIGTGLSAGLILPTWLTSCKEDDPKPAINFKGKVAVIGAGAAGLYAAHYLLTKGINVKVYEASDRIGGRIRSLRRVESESPGLIIPTSIKLTNDFPVELGAERVLGSDSMWAKFLDQRNIATTLLNTEVNDRYFFNGVMTNHPDLAPDAGFQAARDFYLSLSSYTGANISIEQAAQDGGVDAAYNPILDGWIGGTYGAANARASAFAMGDALALRTRNTNDMVLPENLMHDALASVFSKGVQATQLNTVISTIDYSGEKVVISGQQSGEAFTAEVDHVIITVPVSVLKDGDIAFTPALPSGKITALSRMGMDSVIRVVMDFKKNFWQDEITDPELRFIFGGTQAAQYFNAGTGRGEIRNILSATVIGPKAEELSPKGVQIVPDLLAELDDMFEGKATQQIRSDETGMKVVVIQDWGKEPFIRGGNAYVKPGGSNNDREELAEPVNNKLFFAGEATDVKGEFGTVNGALQSAERAALELIAVITAS